MARATAADEEAVAASTLGLACETEAVLQLADRHLRARQPAAAPSARPHPSAEIKLREAMPRPVARRTPVMTRPDGQRAADHGADAAAIRSPPPYEPLSAGQECASKSHPPRLDGRSAAQQRSGRRPQSGESGRRERMHTRKVPLDAQPSWAREHQSLRWAPPHRSGVRLGTEAHVRMHGLTDASTTAREAVTGSIREAVRCEEMRRLKVADYKRRALAAYERRALEADFARAHPPPVRGDEGTLEAHYLNVRAAAMLCVDEEWEAPMADVASSPQACGGHRERRDVCQVHRDYPPACTAMCMSQCEHRQASTGRRAACHERSDSRRTSDESLLA